MPTHDDIQHLKKLIQENPPDAALDRLSKPKLDRIRQNVPKSRRKKGREALPRKIQDLKGDSSRSIGKSLAGSKLGALKNEYDQATKKWMSVLTEDLQAAVKAPPPNIHEYKAWVNGLLDCFIAAIKIDDDENLYRMHISTNGNGVESLALISSADGKRPTKGFGSQENVSVVPDTRKAARRLDHSLSRN